MSKNVIAIAQDLQVKREDWKSKLDELPLPKSGEIKFPYGSMEAAIADNFALLANGEKLDGFANAFRILVKGYKTEQWRKVADHNRQIRDEIAEGELPEIPKKRTRKKVEKVVPVEPESVVTE